MFRNHLIILLLLLACSCKNNPVNPGAGVGSNSFVVGSITDKYCYPIRPIVNATLILSSQSTFDTTSSDSTGRFQFHQVPSGSHGLIAWANMYDTVALTFSTNAQDITTLNVELALTYQFRAGTVWAGFADSVGVDSVVQLFVNLGLTVKGLMGFDCQSLLSPDSLSYVRAVLGSKPYLKETDHTIFVQDGVIQIVGRFVNIDLVQLDDWKRTEAQLRIVSVPSHYRDGEFQTQAGQEIYWVRALRGYSMIRWLDLDWSIPIILDRQTLTGLLPPNNALKLPEGPSI